jgi:hypothetical protein
MPGPKKDIVEQVELYMKGKKPLIPLSVHTGVPFIAFLAVTLTLYVGAGVPIGARRSGAPLALGAHPHYAQWQELAGLAKDGLAYSLGVIGTGGGAGAQSQKASGDGSMNGGGGMDGRSLLSSAAAEETAAQKTSKGKGAKRRKDKREERIEASDARVARLLAKEDERARQEGAAALPVEIEEVFYSGGRHSSQAAVRVRGLLGADDADDDLALDLR